MAPFTNGNFSFWGVAADACFEISSVAYLSFGLLFLIFICKFRASLTINKNITF